MNTQHLSLDDLRAAVFRHGDEHPDYTCAWQDEAQRGRVTAHLALCHLCRGRVDDERHDNDVYQLVCVERKFTWDELDADIKASNAAATFEHNLLVQQLVKTHGIIRFTSVYEDGKQKIVAVVAHKTPEVEAAIPKSIDGIDIIVREDVP